MSNGSTALQVVTVVSTIVWLTIGFIYLGQQLTAVNKRLDTYDARLTEINTRISGMRPV